MPYNRTRRLFEHAPSRLLPRTRSRAIDVRNGIDVAVDASRIAFVLFKPQSAGNIGAAARALMNMGFADLRLIAPEADGKRARRDAAIMAVHAQDLLAGARTYPDLAAALDDRTLTVGTTCRAGPYRSGALKLHDTAAELAALRGERVAVIFGPEDRGLTNNELKLCQRLIRIPTASGYSSINLAQAVMLVAYELMIAGGAAGRRDAAPDRIPKRAETTAIDAMFERLARALTAIGFLPEDNPDHIMFTLRAIVARSGLDTRELDIFNGIARQIGWFAGGGHEKIAAKRRAGRRLR